MPANRLIHEKSPYLQQHAHNPVDWYAWGEAAFEKARSEDKPIFLSIGYSTCHWCHVMERESFESDEVAAILNRSFVAVKVDREERPDVDRIYMLFVQATTGSGGWPMSVWLTPDRKPFFGGTYFPPDNRYGRPGFPAVLEHIALAWQTERAKILESSDAVSEQLKHHAEVSSDRTWIDETQAMDSAFYAFRRGFDPNLGGFGGAPKFPRPVVHNFLLRYHRRARSQEALDMVLLTLREMAKGGMHDQLGGGFHRYSVDANWFVPHFEKMLYDQAQLAASYLEAHQITGDPLYAAVARDIFDYVLRDSTHPDGGFYSAEDADSVIDPAQPREKGEGAFYIWTRAEISALLDARVTDWFCYRYGVEENGNVSSDPHAEFTGRNILFEAHTIDETASHFSKTVDEVRIGLAAAAGTLLEARAARIRPHLDDKVLTAWNGLMISAFAKGAQVLDDERYLAAARRATDFVRQRLLTPEGVLLRRFRDGDAAIPGFLDDYAFFTQALLDLYETTFDPRDLDLAVKLAHALIDRFEDAEHGAFFSTALGDSSLLLRMKDDHDGAEPAANSIAAIALLRLAQITGERRFAESAARTLTAFNARLQTQAVSVPQMLVALDLSRATPRQVIIAGARDAADTRALLRVVHRRFAPHQVLLLAGGGDPIRPEVKSMQSIDGRATAYVCENFTCQLPTSDPEQLAQLLQ